jgi:hypothetical protein
LVPFQGLASACVDRQVSAFVVGRKQPAVLVVDVLATLIFIDSANDVEMGIANVVHGVYLHEILYWCLIGRLHMTSTATHRKNKYHIRQLITAKENPMFSMNIFRRNPRPYSNRLPPKLARRAMLSVRIHEATRRSFGELADQRGMSVSEYVCQLLNDHLREVDQQPVDRNPSWSTS